MRALILAAGAALVLAAGAGSATTTHPGKNGLVAYTKRTAPCIGGQCAESIWVSALDGSNARELTPPVRRKDHQRRHATWSPDGTMIAYVDDTGPRRFGSSPQELWVVNANGTGRKRVVPYSVLRIYNQRPSWTADGKELAFLLPASGVVLAADVRTGKIRELLRLPRGASAIDLSPSGKLVAFTLPDGALFVRRMTGGGSKRVAKTTTYGFNDNFAWSPNSAQLVFLTESPYGPAVVSASGGPVRRLLDADPNDRWNDSSRPIWSPDGRTILWQVLYHGGPDPANPGRFHSVYDWDRFRAIDVVSGKVTVVGPGAGSCRIQTGANPDTGKQEPPSPCPVSDPSWQPRR